MTVSARDMRDYLIKEQGFDEKIVKKLSIAELYETYMCFHEEY